VKYTDRESVLFLEEISRRYEVWKKDNLELKGPFKSSSLEEIQEIICERVKLLNSYKDFLDIQKYAEHFDSRSNLHSSVLEEFMYYLFKDIVEEISPNALIGKSHSFKDIFFRSSSYGNMVERPYAVIEKKDHDFSIGISVNAEMNCNGSQQNEVHIWDIPAIAIECKTYLDKTMLQDVSTAAEEIKLKNPNAMYIVVAEWIKLTENINLKKYKVDQIYVLRKQKNTDREYRFLDGYVKNPIYEDAVMHLFILVKDFLTSDWEGGVNYGLQNGYLL
ncbi:TPA: Bpu10I family restriction endonuclease, partial [Salmonella enterica subsp. enterica serovar Chailey]|nr:Bpu10I family restriction endonuclease [Salmonella enterica]EBU6383527.1 Bpu10I family restriction endonuclease [Salmonella enterica subsp. enterica serovar Hadar]HBJ6968506.1 Bpu10I family restriction endonuclease [Salmonella enterica subsp. enterica serovar Chailey]EAY0441011.1 Bpu10I family restriction endonuclease [Salmonella enterica]EBK0648576.1 Bpu10I family restriction endonuclease [Salmonella enterica]